MLLNCEFECLRVTITDILSLSENFHPSCEHEIFVVVCFYINFQIHTLPYRTHIISKSSTKS